jgi:hypothetical protein
MKEMSKKAQPYCIVTLDQANERGHDASGRRLWGTSHDLLSVYIYHRYLGFRLLMHDSSRCIWFETVGYDKTRKKEPVV